MYWHVNQDLASLLHISSYLLNLGAKNLSCKRRQYIAVISIGGILQRNHHKQTKHSHASTLFVNDVITLSNISYTCEMFLQRSVNWGNIMLWSSSTFSLNQAFHTFTIFKRIWGLWKKPFKYIVLHFPCELHYNLKKDNITSLASSNCPLFL